MYIVKRVRRLARWMRRFYGLLRLFFLAWGDFARWVKFKGKLNRFAWPTVDFFARLYRAATLGRQTVVAVVGSLGKTTTTRAAMAVLKGKVPDWIHAGNNCFGLIGINLMRQGPWSRFAAIEVGIGGRKQMGCYAALLKPDMVIVTAVATDHLSSLGGEEGLWQEKAAMVKALRPEGWAVLNGDDAAVMRMAGVTRARIVTFGLTPACDVFADGLEISPQGSRFVLHAEGRTLPIRSRLIGREAVRAQVGAAAAGRVAGIPWELVVKRLESQVPTPGRMQPVPITNGAIALCDDFKASFETVHAALDAMGRMRGRRVVVLGNLFRPPWPRIPKYEAIGSDVARVADRVILIGNRSALYRRGWNGLLDDAAVTSVRTTGEAADLLRAELRPGDVVLLKGRGEQKLSRIALALSGVKVGCRLKFCKFENVLCHACPKLEKSS